MTIMALSERAAQFAHDRIEAASTTSSAAVTTTRAQLRFSEVMAGSVVEENGREVELEFEVRALLEVDAEQQRRERGATFGLEGLLRYPGVAEAAPCVGSLRMRPGQRRGTLRYELDFDADDGRSLCLVGEKHVSPFRSVKGMTTLYTEVLDGKRRLAEGVLYFDLKGLVPWLGTWSYDAPRS